MSCGDAFLLQRLLDGDLDEAQAELISHHLESCAKCRATIKDAAALRSFAEEHLAMEDEAEEDAAAETLARIAERLPQKKANRWRALMAVAAVITAVFILPLVFVTSVNAWTERILEKASLRERIWKFRPNHILAWQVDANIQGIRNKKSGHWRTQFWQKNATTTLRQISYQFDPDGEISHAYWHLADGSYIRYEPKEKRLEETPAIDALRGALALIPPEERVALNALVERRELARNLNWNRDRESDWLHRASIREGETTTVTRDGNVYHLSVRVNRPHDRDIDHAVHEYEIDAETYRLLRLRSTVTYADGTSGFSDARWSAFHEITDAEFAAQTPEALFGKETAVVQLTPEALAQRTLHEMKKN